MSLAMNVQLAAPRAASAAAPSSRGSSSSLGDAPSSFGAALSTATQAHSAEQGGHKQAVREADSTTESTPDAVGAPNTQPPVTAANGEPRAATWSAAGMFQLASGAAEAAAIPTDVAAQPTADTDASADGTLSTAIAAHAVAASGSSTAVVGAAGTTAESHAATAPVTGAAASVTSLLGAANPTAQAVSASATGAAASVAPLADAAPSHVATLAGTGAARIASATTPSAATQTMPVAAEDAGESNPLGAALGVASDGASADGNAPRHSAASAAPGTPAPHTNPGAFGQTQAAPPGEAVQQRSDVQPLAAPATASPPAAAAASAPVSTVSGASGTTAPNAPVAQPSAPLHTQLARPILTVVAAGDGTHTLTVTVTPERLGPVTVQAVVAGDKLRLELFAPTEQAREAVRGILGDLRRDLAGTGLHTSLGLSADDAPSKQGNGQLAQHGQSGSGAQAARDALAGEQRGSAQHDAEKKSAEPGTERARSAQLAAVADADALAGGAAAAASAHTRLDLIA